VESATKGVDIRLKAKEGQGKGEKYTSLSHPSPAA